MLPSLPENAPVPAFPGWTYGVNGIFKETDANGEFTPVRQINWCPIVTRHLIVPNDAGEIVDRLITITVGDVTATVPPKDLRDARVWDRFPAAVGTHKRVIRDVLAHVIEDQAAKLPTVSALPRWHAGQMELPPQDVIVKGYATTAGDEAEALTAWRRISEIAARNPRLALVLGTAAGAPYLPGPIKQSFWVHLNGGSSQGKTTASRVAAAVFGHPELIITPWNVTPIALTGMLGELGFLPAFFDEIQAARWTPAQLQQAVFTTTEGAQRTRSTREGRTRVSPSWHGVLFSTGNESIIGQIANEAMAARVIEVPTPIVADAQTADDLDALVQVGPGWPFQWLRQSGMRPDTLSVQQHFPLPAGGVPRRLGQHLTLGLAGAAVLEHLLSVQGIYAAAVEAAHEILTLMLAELADRGMRPSERLLDAVEQALSSRPGAFPERGESVRDYARIEGFDLTADELDGDVAILTAALGQIARDVGISDPTPALRQLRDEGRLATGEGVGLRKRLRVGRWTPWAYVFRLTSHDLPSDGGNSGNKHALGASDQAKDCSHPAGNTGNTVGTGQPAQPAQPQPVPALFRGEPKPCLTCGHDAAYRWHGKPYHVPCAPGHLDTEQWEQVGTVGTQEALDTADRIAPALRAPGEPPRPEEPPRSQPSPAPVREITDVPAPSDDVPAPSAAVAEIPAEHFANFARAVRRSYPDASERDLWLGLRRFTAVTAAAMRQTAGLRFAGSPAIVGTLLFHALEKRYESIPQLDKVKITPPAKPGAGLVNAWNGVLAEVDLSPGWIVSLDVNSQYLAAAGSLDLGTGQPETMTGAEVFRPTTLNTAPGYVRLAEPVKLAPWAEPVPAGDWLMMPMVKYAAQRGLITAGHVDEALIWPERRRWLGAWCKAVKGAMDRLRGHAEPSALYALAALKEIYAAFLGGHMRSERYNRTRTLRPDWQDMIVAQAWANMLRSLESATIPPFCVVKDTAYFVTSGPGVYPEGLTVSRQPGKWKPARKAPITPAIRTAITRGLAYKVRDAVAAEYKAAVAAHSTEKGIA